MNLNKTDTFDYIIAGAGAAGLTLLWHMMKDLPSHTRILLIDSSFDPVAHKIWSFWSPHSPPPGIKHHCWNRLDVICGGQKISEKPGIYSYYSIRSEDYQNEILNMARERENITLLETTVLNFRADEFGGVVITEKGDFRACWIFQSVLKAGSHESARVDSSLIQHFTGWEVETNRTCFDTGSVTLMDLDTEQKDGLTFFYTLPFSETRALIEYTIFSPSPLGEAEYELALCRYMKKRLKLDSGNYSVKRREIGRIPMEDRRVPGFYNRRTMNIGTVGGLTKPTTGYTFTRIQSHSREISQALSRNRDPEPFTGSEYRYRVYDILLLDLRQNEPDICREIFQVMFQRNSMQTILQFLGEETNLLQELGTLSKMPWAPFFRAIYRRKRRILSGA